MLRSVKRDLRWTGALAALAAIMAQGARADDVLDHVPADAKAVLVLRSMAGLSGSVQKFAQAAGLPSQDIAAKASDAWQGTLDLDRPMAMVLTNLMPPMGVGLVPCADPAAAIRKLGGTGQGDGPFAVTIEGQAKQAMAVGKYVAVSDNAEALAAFRSPKEQLSKSLPSGAAPARTRGEFFFHANVAAVKPEIDQALGMAKGMAANIPIPGQDAANVKAAFDAYFGAAEAAVANTTALYGSVSIAAEGVDVKTFADVREGALGTSAGDAGTSGSLLAGLPADEFLFAGGIDMARLGPGITQFGIRLAAAAYGDAPEFRKLMQEWEPINAKVKSMGMVFGATGGKMGFSARIATSDPAGYMRMAKKGSEWMAGPGKELMEKQNVSVKSSVKTVDGAEVVRQEFDFSQMPEPGRQMVEKIYGGAMVQEIAALDEGAVGMAMGRPVMGLKKAGGLDRDARVRKATAALPPNPIAVMLVDPIGGVRMIQAMDLPNLPQLNVPAESPAPFALGVGGRPGGLEIHIRVPAETVRALSKLRQDAQ